MAGPDLVEKVARAICLSDGDDPDRLWNVEHPELRWLIYRENAQSAIVAVLDAIAVPDAAMVDKISEVINPGTYNLPRINLYRSDHEKLEHRARNAYGAIMAELRQGIVP